MTLFATKNSLRADDLLNLKYEDFLQNNQTINDDGVPQGLGLF